MGRRFRGRVLRDRPEHRINRHIRFPQIRVIAPDGEALGVMSPDEGRAVAQRFGLDLVEVSPNTRPPVCRVMDYGKFKYERAKQKKAAKKSSSSLKTVQMRPQTDDHDLETIFSKARSFLEDGDRVRFVMRLRGRERAYPQRWARLLHARFKDTLGNFGRVASPPSHQGRAISMVVEPVGS